jgi:hypothetical protein
VCTAAAACPTTIPSSCTGTETVQLCQQMSDCTDATYKKCCTFSGSTLTFCVDSTTAISGTCH